MTTIATVIADLQAALADAQAIVTPAPAPPPQSGEIVTLGLTFSSAGLHPFACAQTFKRGDVPAGSSVIASVSTFQCVPWSFYDDGSVRHARVAGYASGPITLSLGTPTTGVAVAPTMPNVQVATPWGTVDTTKLVPTATVASGPQMTQCYGRWPIGSDPVLKLYVEWRVFRNGEIEIFVPSIENCTWMTPSTTQTGAITVTINGSKTFSGTVLIAQHTRTALLNGSQWSYWTSDPGVTVLHDPVYLLATESLPSYPVQAPTAGLIGKTQQTFMPGYCGDDGPAMAAAGNHHAIGLHPLASVYYLTASATDKAAALNYMMSQALSAGSWSSHWRDEKTGALPLFSAWPTAGVSGGNSTINADPGTGATNGGSVWDTAHQPSFTYVPAITTGWDWFVEEHLSWAVANHFHTADSLRGGAAGWLRTDIGANQDRGAAWALRTLAQAVAVAAPTHPLYADLAASWAANMAWYRARYVDGTTDGGTWKNAIGIIGPYCANPTSLYPPLRGSTGWWGAAWMQSFLTAALGHATELSLPVPAQAKSDLGAVFTMSAAHIVGLLGDGSAGTFNWRRGFVYALPFGPDQTINPGVSGKWYADYGAVWNDYNRSPLLALDPSPGGSLKYHDAETDLTVDDWQIGFPGNHFPGLAYAAQFGVPGAAAAIAHVTGSSSWALTASWPDVPTWCVLPPGVALAAGSTPIPVPAPVPVPTPVPAPAPGSVAATFYTSMSSGTIKNVSRNTVQSVNPCQTQSGSGCAWSGWVSLPGLFNDTGVVFMPWLGTLGSIVFKGGGHSDYYGNEVYCFDIATQLVSRLTDPSANIYVDTTALAAENAGTLTQDKFWRLYHAHAILGELWVDGTFPPFGTGDGYPAPLNNKATMQNQPGASHMFGYQVALPPGFGHTDPQGALLTTCLPSLTPVGSAVGQIAHILPMTPGSDGGRHWARFSSDLMTQACGNTGAFLDTKRRTVLSHTYGGNFDVLILDAKTRTLQKVTNGRSSLYYGTWAYDSARDIYAYFRGPVGTAAPMVWVVDPATFTEYAPALSGTVPPATATYAGVTGPTHGGASWVPALGGFVYYAGDAGMTAYSIVPSGDPRTAAWTVTAMPFTGDQPIVQFSAIQSFHMARFNYVEALDGFFWTADTKSPIQFWKR